MLRTQLCSVLVVLALAAPVVAGDGEIQVLTIEDVPTFIVDIAKSKIANADWLTAFQDEAGGYRLVGKLGKLGRAEFICNAEGKDHLMFLPVSMSNVPETVKAALLREMPKFEVEGAHVCSLDGKKVFSYRFQGKGYDGGSTGFFGVFVSSNASKVTPMK
jgi:hypothetical protein